LRRNRHVTSDTVSAGIILVAIYREEKDPREKRQLYADVKACISVLGKGGSTDNNLVQIGVNLLNNFLRSAGSPPPPPPVLPPPAASHSSASTSTVDSHDLPPPPPHSAFHHSTFEPPIQRPIPVFDPSSPAFPPYDPSLTYDLYLSHLDPQLRTSTVPSSSSHSHAHPPAHAPSHHHPSAHTSTSLPDLWSSLDFSAEHPAGFDPFGGWEGSALAGYAGDGPGGGGVTWASTGTGAGAGAGQSGAQSFFPAGGAEAVEYNPSRPTAQW